MKLLLERNSCGPTCTIGSLYVDGAFECYTCEDAQRGTDSATVKEWKVAGQTAIPYGTYNVVITPSARFKRDLPLLENVPGFEGIRIHPGNTAEDTEGCLLVGNTKGPTFVGESKAAFAKLFHQLRSAIDAGDTVTIEIGHD